jgi:hypothetical protein
MSPFQKKQPNYTGLAAAIAAALSAAVGLAVAYQKSGIHKEVEARAKVLAKNFNKNRAAVQKNVQEIFGKVSVDLEKAYLEVQSNVIAAMDQFKSQVNQKNLEKTIDEIVQQFAKAQKWSQQTAEKFSKNLQKEWAKQAGNFQKAAQNSAKSAKVSVKKASPAAKKTAKKVVKKAKKTVRKAAKLVSSKGKKKGAKK